MTVTAGAIEHSDITSPEFKANPFPLLQHPDQMEQLRADPSLINLAIEELLRYTARVFMSTERFAREDVTIRGVTIRQGEIVFGGDRLCEPRRVSLRKPGKARH